MRYYLILQLETETSESLILHSIERGYSDLECQSHDADTSIDLATKQLPTPDLIHASALPLPNRHSTGSTKRSGNTTASAMDNNTSSTSTANSTSLLLNKMAPVSQSSPTSMEEEEEEDPKARFRERTRSAANESHFKTAARQKLDDSDSTSAFVPISDNVMRGASGARRAAFAATSGTGIHDNDFAGVGGVSSQKPQSSFPKPSLRRLSSFKHVTLNLGLDARNMDGVFGNENGKEGIDGIMSDYVVRVISIHNECWRVQLPDQETMDRWIDIGQQIKGANWVTRPITSHAGSSGMGAKKGTASSYYAYYDGRRRSSLDGGPRSSRANGHGTGLDFNNGVGFNSSRYDFRKGMISPREPSGPIHPLQIMVDNNSHAQANSSTHFNSTATTPETGPEPYLQPISPHPRPTNPFRPDGAPHRMYSDIADRSISSKGTDRLMSREQAARLNQQLRASSSSRYGPFRSLVRGPGGLGYFSKGNSSGLKGVFGVGLRRLDSSRRNSCSSIPEGASTTSLTSSQSSRASSSSLRRLSRPAVSNATSLDRFKNLPIKLRMSVLRSTPNNSGLVSLRSSTSINATDDALAIAGTGHVSSTGAGAGPGLAVKVESDVADPVHTAEERAVNSIPSLSAAESTAPNGKRLTFSPSSSVSMECDHDTGHSLKDSGDSTTRGTTAADRHRNQTDIKDILAETKIAYVKDQHAIYYDGQPGYEHRGYRFFNNLQYSYDNKFRSRTRARPENITEMDRFDRSAVQQEGIGRKTVGNRGRHGFDFGLNLGDGGDEGEERSYRPQSPRWHLTSSELAIMEAKVQAEVAAEEQQRVEVSYDRPHSPRQEQQSKQQELGQAQPLFGSSSDNVLVPDVPYLFVTMPQSDTSPEAAASVASRSHQVDATRGSVSLFPMMHQAPPTPADIDRLEIGGAIKDHLAGNGTALDDHEGENGSLQPYSPVVDPDPSHGGVAFGQAVP
ncbi:hypothetical protein EDD11_004748 [Mortierella claussenii]|nr:hypothetical protein EDD11_004748 [Mortierella claussenii]